MLIPSVKIRHRLFTRLLISYILLVTITLVVTGQILVNTAQDAIEKTIQERNLELAERSAWLIESTLNRANDILKFGAQSLAFYTDDRLSQELIINNLVNQYPIFERITVLDTLGHIISSTAYGTNVDSLVHNGIYNILADQGSFSSDVYVSREKLPLMDVIEPIVVFGEVDAIFWAVVDLKALWTLVDNNVVGRKSEAFIFKIDGQFIAHSDRRKVLERKKFEEYDIIRQVIAGESGHKIYTDKNHVEMIAAYSPIPGKDWGTVVQQPTSEAFAPSRKMLLQVILIMLGSLLVAAIIAAIYATQIVKPVNLLIAGIEKIAAGDLRYRIPRTGRDEISTLALHFNAMTARLRRIQDKLKRTERLETLGKLSSVLSHEIRNPLNSMVINMQLMKREFHKGKKEFNLEKLNHYHTIVSSEIQRVDNLVSNFLRISKPPKLDKTTQKLSQFLDSMIKAELPELLPKGIRISRDYRETDLWLNIDASKIYQVFLNIFINATHAMPGGGNLTIGIEKVTQRASEDGHEYALIYFQDTGRGINSEEMSKIFDFYYSTKKRGTGIGLAIALQIVEEHGGTIKVESKLGVGSKFMVYLPLDQ